MKPENLEPEITGLEFYFDAFRELSTARPIGLAVGPIPFTAIVEYFTIYELTEDFDDFLFIVRQLDRVFLELNSQDTSSKGSNNAAGNADKNNTHKG